MAARTTAVLALVTAAPLHFQRHFEETWFADTRRLHALTAELEALSLKEMTRAEG